MFARATLPAEPASASAARRFVRATLAEWQAQEFIDSASLLVSELVTNAILHAGSPSVVSISLSGKVLRIEVSDSSQLVVRPRSYSADAGTGRGLLLVEALARDWGSAVSETGKHVWFELDRDSLASAG